MLLSCESDELGFQGPIPRRSNAFRDRRADYPFPVEPCTLHRLWITISTVDNRLIEPFLLREFAAKYCKGWERVPRQALAC